MAALQSLPRSVRVVLAVGVVAVAVAAMYGTATRNAALSSLWTLVYATLFFIWGVRLWEGRGDGSTLRVVGSVALFVAAAIWLFEFVGLSQIRGVAAVVDAVTLLAVVVGVGAYLKLESFGGGE
ncbi:hypothetical protein AUR64_08550 [Haloprofundus marisrubri]|uniref:Uncharacterized protein n=1 Tax=Haloprofundus marisrubri TaxID=1514971 RepID=A0A0W1R9H2_9EURY|nr:hypothetical protein [Haloprofundus marisrubri]KTG09682.1 hypothetical protein AUR64_08550 [Haloprofundus marisrubri]